MITHSAPSFIAAYNATKTKCLMGLKITHMVLAQPYSPLKKAILLNSYVSYSVRLACQIIWYTKEADIKLNKIAKREYKRMWSGRHRQGPAHYAWISSDIMTWKSPQFQALMNFCSSVQFHGTRHTVLHLIEMVVSQPNAKEFLLS